MPFLPPNQQRQSTEGDYCIQPKHIKSDELGFSFALFDGLGAGDDDTRRSPGVNLTTVDVTARLGQRLIAHSLQTSQTIAARTSAGLVCHSTP